MLEEELREIAREIGAQLVGVTGVGTQYCWTIFRKPNAVSTALAGSTVPPNPPMRPRILEAGRVEDLQKKEVPAAGIGIGLLVEGLDRETVDANNLVVEIGETRVRPFYVGTTTGWPKGCLQVSFPIPVDHLGGDTSVVLMLPDGVATEPVAVKILQRQPIVPRIELVSSHLDGSLEIFARGPGSKIRVHTQSLGEDASPENIRVVVATRILKPESVSFIPANAIWLLTAQLPEETVGGDVELSVRYHDLESAPVSVHIKDV